MLKIQVMYIKPFIFTISSASVFFHFVANGIFGHPFAKIKMPAAKLMPSAPAAADSVMAELGLK